MKAILLALALLALSGCSVYTTSTTRPVIVGFSLGVGLEEHFLPPVPPHRHYHRGHYHDHHGRHVHRHYHR